VPKNKSVNYSEIQKKSREHVHCLKKTHNFRNFANAPKKEVCYMALKRAFVGNPERRKRF